MNFGVSRHYYYPLILTAAFAHGGDRHRPAPVACLRTNLRGLSAGSPRQGLAGCLYRSEARLL